MDTLTQSERSERMSRIRSKDTHPEMRVRRMLHRLGYRYRLHRRIGSTRPDVVLRKHNAVIFVHGCFWHRHACKNGCRTPKTNVEFWVKKKADNVRRDRRNQRELRSLGGRVLVIWECQTRDEERLAKRLNAFLTSRGGG